MISVIFIFFMKCISNAIPGTHLGNQVDPQDLVCHATTGQCACLPSREGRTCDMCSPGSFIIFIINHYCRYCFILFSFHLTITEW